LLADTVAKVFLAFGRATLIQVQAPARNIDSKFSSSGFDCCPFFLASCSAATFATISALNGHSATAVESLLLGAKQTQRRHVAPFESDLMRESATRQII
jgi:hypothetical protein